MSTQAQRPFIHDDFLLDGDEAVRLYHEFAASEPIIDYHCHLPPADIATNRRFTDLHEIWLEGDHYKWRAMRAAGIDERFCTGDAEPKDKFMAWARTVPETLRNPLFHWSHLELKRYFGIEGLLDPSSADDIWSIANEQLKSDALTAHGILHRFDIRALCTTDDPADDLTHHEQIAARNAAGELATRVYPTFRPDGIQHITAPPVFNAWLDRLAATADTTIATLDDFITAIDRRHAAFHEAGCRLSDHGLTTCFATDGTEADAARTFDNARAGRDIPTDDADRFCGFMMEVFGRLDAGRGWTKQLHIGALRNTNSRRLEQLGRDTGFDSIGDRSHAERLAAYLDVLDRNDALPRIILYNLNPADNYVFATMAGNFQDGRTPGKIQFGAGWWFLDQLDGMRWQLDALSNNGLLSRFIGMLTDSRSFMSYPRHEYFRRLLSNILGHDMKTGRLPHDFDLVGDLVRRICFANARDYLELEVPANPAPQK